MFTKIYYSCIHELHQSSKYSRLHSKNDLPSCINYECGIYKWTVCKNGITYNHRENDSFSYANMHIFHLKFLYEKNNNSYRYNGYSYILMTKLNQKYKWVRGVCCGILKEELENE